MKYRAQIFGGRGGGSGRGGGGSSRGGSPAGVSFTDSKTGKEYNYYFYKGDDGKNYYSTSIGGLPKPTPNNMSHEEMVERLKQNTGNVKSISKAEKAKAEKTYKAERAEVDRQLNNAYANEKEFVKRSRAVRKGLRGTKRGI